ncbi:Hypothetical predicted protein [Podarcis lilfordi]|uniref:Uncharacterized protein n=1 Tax=Podarcis lilfordi TaxID=74358 RepID=A0AA35K3A7_9SAUR|nr:Hypothetical predicted protein [Podarcis lilfordi]
MRDYMKSDSEIEHVVLTKKHLCFAEQDAYYKACRKNVCGKWHNAKLMKPEDLLCTKESYENVPVQENAETP